MIFRLQHTKIIMQHTKLSGQPIICQLLSFVPKELVQKAVSACQSDYYYKTMTTWKQFVFIFYGVISKVQSLNSLCKCLLFLEGKLSYLGIYSLPPTSTLSDANRNRNSEVFGHLYYYLFEYYAKDLSNSYLQLPVNGEVNPEQVKLFDSTTISLFVDIFKGAGRNPLNGQKKGGLKIHALLPLDSMVPELIWMSPGSENDKNFLGQLEVEKGIIYIFDKGYVNYSVYKDWTTNGTFYVTRLNDNAVFEKETEVISEVHEYLWGGVILDQIIVLKKGSTHLKARLVTYKDPLSGKVLRFISNLFDYQSQTIVMLYKNRWEIEVIFKQLKQNFELAHFYSDSSEGIKTQIWIALIANLIFSIIHRKIKQCEQFTTLVAMARANMVSFVCLISIVMAKKIKVHERDIEKIQLSIFEIEQGGVLNKIGKSP
jgi:hypothetical protein